MLNADEFAVKTVKPLPVILLVDASGSMGEVIDTTGMRSTGQKVFEDGQWWNVVEGGTSRMQVLNQACRKMVADWADIENGEREVDLSVITFGEDIQVRMSLTPASRVEWSDLPCGGETPLGAALRTAKAMIEDKGKVPGRAYRATVVLVSDGRPDPGWEEPLRQFVSEGRSAKCDRMAMGIGTDFDRAVLERFIENTGPDRKVFSAEDATAVKEFFKYVTMSVTVRTMSQNPNVVPTDKQLSEIASDRHVTTTVLSKSVSPQPSSLDDDESFY